MKHITLSRRNFIKHACALPAAVGVMPGTLSAMTNDVIKRVIPSSGEEISIMGMGTYSTFSHSTPLEQLGEVMQAFFDHGGQMIDSSPMYGPAEGIVGELLKTTQNTAGYFAATKVWTDGREAGIRQMNESMRLMGVETMDLMQIHNLRDWKVHLKTLKEWKEQGRIRYLGITTSHGRYHDELETIMKTEPLDFVQLTYSAANRLTDERLLPLAHDRGIATIINRPYQGGSLFRKVRGKPLPDWAGEIDCTSWGQFFLKFIAGHPAVTCIIPATSKVRHILDNMAGGTGRVPDAAQRRRMIDYLEAL
ncbi:MAG: aldo/keto reductase [Gammaproteobacteria bacterium]|nr:aldo/keto reductase [Gammaproteobacteria bacterium]MDE0513117.1 aldo/keto reductase [Gammaproteobacteria bacterium]